MNAKTFEDYKNAILEQYLQCKNGEYATYLISPTPAGLRELALLCFENTGTTDKVIFKEFFNLDELKDTKKQIENFKADRFKGLCSFFNKKTSLRLRADANLAAVLVNFNPRPFNKFLKADIAGFAKEPGLDNLEAEKKLISTGLPDIEHATEPLPFINDNDGSKKRRKQMFLWLIGVLPSIVCIILIFKEEKKCIVWKENHYEQADCNDIALQGEGYAYRRLNVDLLKKMKKVQVCDTTTFFNKYGKPCIWYGKSANKKYEFFTMDGNHPETGEELNSITPYIITKYVKADCK